jgi:hypothetical protein
MALSRDRRRPDVRTLRPSGPLADLAARAAAERRLGERFAIEAEDLPGAPALVPPESVFLQARPGRRAWILMRLGIAALALGLLSLLGVSGCGGGQGVKAQPETATASVALGPTRVGA